MADVSYDIAVIGAGPGGYVAALRAAQLGFKTVVVEREHLGGICLNWGCIPTKALLRSADLYRSIRHAEAYGLKVQGAEADLAAVVKRSRAVAAQLSAGVKGLLKKNKVDVVLGAGRLLGPGRVGVSGKDQPDRVVSARHVILAAGARARVFPGMEPDGKVVWTYKEALVADRLPKSLLVVGSGAIGIEFAGFFNALGSKVTVVEVMDRIVPVEDEEISAALKASLEKQGMTILTGAKVQEIKRLADSAKVKVERNGAVQDFEVDRVIVAVGIVPNVEDLGLEKTKVKIERGFVATDPWLQTDEPGVYAIGDLTPGPWLAHKASHEAVICVEKIAGLPDVHPLDRRRIPGCTYCHPQIASVGLTEKKAAEAGHKIRVGRFPFVGNGKAIALGESEGFVKTVFDAETGELLGAHMIGSEVTELIHGYAMAQTLETTEAELMHTVFPHPTLSEAMHESVLDAYGRALHF